MIKANLKDRETQLATKEAELAKREHDIQTAGLGLESSRLEHEKKLTDPKLTVWQKLIDMSIHFNELCLNVRRFALTTLASLLAASGIAFRYAGGLTLAHPILSSYLVPTLITLLCIPAYMALVVNSAPENKEPNIKPIGWSEIIKSRSFLVRFVIFFLLTIATIFSTFRWLSPIQYLHIASLFIGTAAVTWILCYLVDRFWYHELLRGVVEESAKIEDKLKANGIEIKVTKQIKHYSQASLLLPAGSKLSVFYLTIYAMLVALLITFLLIPPNNKPEKSDASLFQPGNFEAYPLAGLPAFPQGSADLTSETKTAICTARAALAAMRVDTALVVGRYDQVELSPATKQRYSSNSGLAHARAEQVASILRDSTACPFKPIVHVLALDSAPRNIGAAVDSALLEADRKPEIHGLRIVAAIPARSGWADDK